MTIEAHFVNISVAVGSSKLKQNIEEMYFQLLIVFAIYLIESSSAEEIVTINIREQIETDLWFYLNAFLFLFSVQINEEDNSIAKQAVVAAVNYANNNTEFGVSINLECYDGKNNVSAKIYFILN
jgi:hypothetical protein